MIVSNGGWRQTVTRATIGIMRFLGLLLVPSLVAAAPATKLVMQRVDATNVHLADDLGAMHWDEDTTVTVELGANGKVAASVAGTRKDHNLYKR